MSNDISVISSALPDYLRTGQVQYEDSGIGSGITPKAPKLAVTTAKQWSITKDGQTMILPQPTVKGVLVASAENITKAWYAKGYVPGSTDAPDCFSNDGKTPAPGVKAPQCSNCAMCPKNAFGSHPVTGRGKACSDRKLVVLVWEGAPNELTTFNVPTMSMQSLKKLDTELRQANIPVQSVAVEMSFDPSVLYPVVKIAAIGFVGQETAMNLIARSKTQEVADLLRETDVEPPADGQAQLPSSPVPNQTITLGAAAPETFPQDTAAQAAGAVVQTAEPVKRRRRTKAEMEAARAAEAGASAQTPASAHLAQQAQQQADPQQTIAQQMPQETAQQTQPAATGGLNIADLMAKWKS